MATIEYWIQLENHQWDACPNGIDRMTSEQFAPVAKTLNSPGTNASHVQNMFRPLKEDALIFRRYTANWVQPDDRKVNPWDLNEPDPTDTGTMGTIPGPVIECSVGPSPGQGDTVIVHFRNMDMRTQRVFRSDRHTRLKVVSRFPFVVRAEEVVVVDITDQPLPIERRLHSLHTHGFVFDAKFDGAYPLSPPDPAQPVGTENAAWSLIPGFTGLFKQGDRVPPGGTFSYQWQTIGWPTTAGVWLYHDHSICDMANVELGAIGIVVIHNPADTPDTVKRDVDIRLPAAQNPLGTVLDPTFLPGGSPNGSPIDMADPTNPTYRTPSKALYLQLYHTLDGAPGMCINGRTFLGNTPTMVARPNTLMRFGVVGMGSDFHTFHIHGHRWVIPGPISTDSNSPDGVNPAVLQFGGPMNTPVSQFEDTKIFGPANSFAFTIDEGNSFMRASPQLGEWHMHCHVLDHMMIGMMGSLLVVSQGQAVTPLPKGLPCPAHMGGANTVVVENGKFTPNPDPLMVPSGTQVTFDFQEAGHTVMTEPGAAINATPITINNGGGTLDAVPAGQNRVVTILGSSGGTITYHCGPHGTMMSGTITIM